jgi:hypothetical protein
VIEIGDLVRTVQGGVSLFRVVELEDDEHALIEPVEPAAGAYPGVGEQWRGIRR